MNQVMLLFSSVDRMADSRNKEVVAGAFEEIERWSRYCRSFGYYDDDGYHLYLDYNDDCDGCVECIGIGSGFE